MEMRKTLDAGLPALALALPEEARATLCAFGEAVVKQNEVMNLTAIRDEEGVARLHMLDCAALLTCVDFDRRTLIDVGTGAGFPGMPLRIVEPEIRLTLLDSLNKRIRFLNTVIQELGLENIEAIHGRAEEYGIKEGYREQYDLCVSRAVARLASLCEFCIPFVKKGGAFVAYKAMKSEEELAEAKPAVTVLGAKLLEVKEFKLGEDAQRNLLVIQKTKETPKKYPRQGGKPLKDPILKL